MIWAKLLERLFTWTSAARARFARADVVFIGDSITEFWSAADPWVFRPVRFNRGISGQTTAQMRARFAADVVALRPRMVHIMGGTNDLWFGQPGEGAADTIANIAEMAGAARAAGIAVILAPPPPIGRYAVAFAHIGCAVLLRAGIAELARREGYVLVDYAPSLAPDGELAPRFTTDGIHLTRAGYRAMRRRAEEAIRSAL